MSEFRKTDVSPLHQEASEMAQASEEPIVQVRDLNVSFNSEAGVVRAVRGVNFDLYRGKTLAIVGESGSGKSVTSMAVMGLLDRNATVKGSVLYKGEELLTKTDDEMSKIRGKNLAMVFQDPLSALTPVFSIGDQLREALVTHNPKMTAQQIHDRSIELMKLVGIPQPERRLKSFPHEFSGGMRQRVMIAMAIANDPDVIIADEPTTALDVTIQAQVLEVLKKAQRETGAAVLFITHDLGVVAQIADDVIVMYAGRPVEHARVDTLYAHATMPYSMGLLGAIPRPDRMRAQRLVPIPGVPMNVVNMPAGCPFAPRCPLADDRCRSEEPMLKHIVDPMDPSHTVACWRADEIGEKELTFSDVFGNGEKGVEDMRAPREQRKVVLDVQHMQKTFPLTSGGFLRRKVGLVHAVNDVTLEVREGETVALVGESGSGKSTTLTEIMQLEPLEHGSMTVFGTPVDATMNAARRQLRSAVQFVFQDPMSSLDPRMPIYDILAEPMHVQHYSKEQIRHRVAELMRLVELNPDHVDRFPTQFSGGQRQRIAIARALAVNPKLILLDEPVSALDVSIQAGVINLLEDLQKKLNIAYLFVAHNLSVVRHISNRIAVMYLGNIVEDGDTDEIFDHPAHPYTQALISAVPIPDPVAERSRSRIVLEGEIPSPTEEITGCPFAGRCQLMATLTPEQQARCRGEKPRLRDISDVRSGDHRVACHFAQLA